MINISLGIGDRNQPVSFPNPLVEEALAYVQQAEGVVVIAANQ